MNKAQAILAVLRGEVDRVDVGTEHLIVLGDRRQDRERAAKALRKSATQRHPSLTVAEARQRQAMTK